MKHFLRLWVGAALLLMGCLAMPVQAQIAKVEMSEGSAATQVEDIVIVFKMHFDIGYTDWAEAVLQKYATSMADNTVRSIEQTSDLPQNEQFVWTLPGWPMKYILEHATDANRPQIEKALRDGRLAPHALPFTFETEASDLEMLVRSMSFTSDLNRRFGRPLVRSAKLTDVPSHSWFLPTLLSNAGVNFLHIGCNPGSVSPDVPTLFWWEGPDGSRLLTMNWAEYYGSGVLPPATWPHKTWLAVIHTHENTGAPTAEEVKEVLEEAHTKMPHARVRIGQLEDFYDLLMKENPQLPVVRGDMPDTWIHGYLSMPREMKMDKQNQRMIFNTEALHTQLDSWLGVRTPIDRYVADAVEQSVLFDEHTFGIALTHGQGGMWEFGDKFYKERAAGAYDFMEQSWYEKGMHAHAARLAIQPALRRDLQALANAVATDDKRVVVYNPLPWQRSGVVSLFMEVYQKRYEVKAVRDNQTGEVLPVYNDKNRLVFEAKDVPSLGYKSYTVLVEGEAPVASDLRVDREAGIIENGFFKLTLDPKSGALLSAWDKQGNREAVQPGASIGFGEYVQERYGTEESARYNAAYVKEGAHSWADDEMIRPQEGGQSYRLIRGQVQRIEYDVTPVSVRATAFCQTEEQEDYLLMYTLYSNRPYVEITWNNRSKRATMQAEGGWLAFPFQVDQPEFHLGRTGGVVNPATDFVKNTNHDYYFLNTGMAVTGTDQRGFGLNTPDAPGVSLERMGLTRFSRDFVPTKPNVYVNLYNTQWGTNFTEFIEGNLSAKVYLWSIDAYRNESSLITPTEETRVPLLGVFAEGKSTHALPLSAQGIGLSKKGVLVTAYTKDAPSGQHLLRLWEQAGEDGACTVTFPQGTSYKRAQPCDLRGQVVGQPIPVSNGQLTLSLKAYAPVTLLLE